MSTWTARVAARDRRRPDGFIAPCLLTVADSVPTGPEWIFEVKHDGWRIIARVDGGRPRIWSRNGLDWTKEFSGVAAALVALGRDLILDGEAVCQNPDGSSDFHALRGPDGCSRATLWAFDLLALDGEDLRPLPLEERRGRLERLLRDAALVGIEFSDHATGDGQRMFAAACRMGLEGIVAKRKGSRYVSGRSRHWLKIKNPEFER